MNLKGTGGAPPTGGRCITLARVRAGITAQQLADRLFYATAAISEWERNLRHPNWAALTRILPDLPLIREKGCRAFCPRAAECKGEKDCLIVMAAKSGTYRASGDLLLVRCGKCIYRDKNGRCKNPNGLTGQHPSPEDFCSRGEREV